jgi:5-methylcytosine-specific restriction endonuclease McrA
MSVLVLDRHKKPLMPCSEKRARLLLERKRAAIHRRYPFTIRLKDRTAVESSIQPIRVKIDPGSKTTGIAIVREDKNETIVLALIELTHRGSYIRDNLTARRNHRRHRRSKLRYRAKRFNNRHRRKGWLPPSLQHRVDNIQSWIKRLKKLAPISGIALEFVKFDLRKMENPGISGIEYQQGELFGYEVREYLLEKWKRRCAYCDIENVPLQVEHMHPKAKGGTNRISNLVLSCDPCNKKKGTLPIEIFLADKPERLHKILAQVKRPLIDASAVNKTRWVLLTALKTSGLPVETGSGGRTKWNRNRLNIPKTHATDAACVGKVVSLTNWQQIILLINATGRGAYQRTRLDSFGFPRSYLTRKKRIAGFQTGDMVRASVPSGKYMGVHIGRVAIRARLYFNLQTPNGTMDGINAKYFKMLARSDGYGYGTSFILINNHIFAAEHR